MFSTLPTQWVFGEENRNKRQKEGMREKEGKVLHLGWGKVEEGGRKAMEGSRKVSLGWELEVKELEMEGDQNKNKKTLQIVEICFNNLKEEGKSFLPFWF